MNQVPEKSRAVYFINPLARTPQGGYIPCIAIEGVSGFHRTDWDWGNDLALAEECARRKNEALGFTEQEAFQIQLHSGFIVVDSEPGRGTTFRICFPLAEGPGSDRTPEPEIAGDLPRGTETLLVAEDDPSVRDLIRDVLAPLGYHVLLAPSGADAITTSDSFSGRIDLLLTDVVMPGMNGKQLAEVFRTKRPGMKVLFMSGYAHDALSTQGILEPGAAMILKPLRPITLARQVRQLLNIGT